MPFHDLHFYLLELLSSSTEEKTGPEQFEPFTRHLRRLRVVGDWENVAVAAEFPLGLTTPALEMLELSIACVKEKLTLRG